MRKSKVRSTPGTKESSSRRKSWSASSEWCRAYRFAAHSTNMKRRSKFCRDHERSLSMKKLWIVALLVAIPGAYAQTALKNPSALKERAPAAYKVKFDTSAGVFEVEVHTDWAPIGADRFYNLVKNGYYDSGRFFRVVPGFMVQFGINGNPAIQGNWENANIPDEPVKQGNIRGFISFAKSSAPNSRTTQVFINFKDNSALNP